MKPAFVARIPYLNAAPFHLHWDELDSASAGRWTSRVLPPRQLGMAAGAGEIDAGLMATADYLRLEREFEPLSVISGADPISYGIGCGERVDSVLLFLRSSEEGIRGLQNHPVGVTQESSTSVALLRLLLETQHGIRPRVYTRIDPQGGPPEPDLPAILVIGDTALRWRNRPPDGYRLGFDLAAEWRRWTGLPFVFACWTVRRDLPIEHKQWLAAFLERSLTEAMERPLDLVRDLPPDMGGTDYLVSYLRLFHYRLGPEEWRGIARFRELLGGLGHLH